MRSILEGSWDAPGNSDQCVIPTTAGALPPHGVLADGDGDDVTSNAAPWLTHNIQ